MSIREQYERETGKQARLPIDNEDFAYLQSLERRAACADQLAEACKKSLPFVYCEESTTIQHVDLRAAIAAYEAACKSGK